MTIKEMLNEYHRKVEEIRKLPYFKDMKKKFSDENFWYKLFELKPENDWFPWKEMKKIKPNYTQLKTFSKKICNYDKQFLKSQEELDKKYRSGIDNCVLVSLYNTKPKLFYYNPKNLRKYRYKKLGANYATINEVVNFLNTQFHNDILIPHYNINNGSELYSMIYNEINKNYPLVVCSKIRENNANNHAIAVFGYDNTTIYYYENGKDNYLLKAFCKYFASKLVSDITDSKTQNEDSLPIMHLFNLGYYELIYYVVDNISNLYYDNNLKELKSQIEFAIKKPNFGVLNAIDLRLLIVYYSFTCITINHEINFSNTEIYNDMELPDTFYSESYLETMRELNGKLLNIDFDSFTKSQNN